MPLDIRLLAYCGLYCDLCSVRVAYRENDPRHLERFPARYKVDRTDLSAYDCEGCKGRNLCGPCAIKDCAAPKGHASCADCPDFPCATLDAFANDGIPHHRQAMENLRRIRRDGLAAWFADVEPTLRCSCGARQSWYYACPQQHA